jgi:hypothetical protein
MIAKRVLIGQAVLAGAAALLILVKEFPGLVREVRIWRMADLKSGSKHPS